MQKYYICILVAFIGLLLVMAYYIRQEGFALQNATTFYDDAEARYNRERAQYLDTLNKENVIESNPWIFIGETSGKPSIYPIESLGRLTDSNPVRLEADPRSYYEFDEISYIGLPLPY